MSKRSKRIALHVVLLGVALALPFVAQYLGWPAPPAVLAPGIK